MVAVAAAATATHPPSKGPIPPTAFQPGGPIDGAQVPDFVEAVGRDGKVVGYVSKEAVIPAVGANGLRPAVVRTWPVFADDLVTIVGYMFPDKGFVPTGVDPNTIPDAPASHAPGP